MASRKSVSSYESPLLGPGVWGEGGLPWARRLVRTKRGTRPTLSSIYQKSDLITGTRPKGQEFDVQFKEGWLDADLLKYFLLRFMQHGRIVEGNPRTALSRSRPSNLSAGEADRELQEEGLQGLQTMKLTDCWKWPFKQTNKIQLMRAWQT